MNDLIAEYGEPLDVTRTAPGSYVDGVLVPGTSSTLNIRAAVIPLTPDQIVSMNLGDRAKAAIVVYTTTPLLDANDDTGQSPDLVSWEGRAFEVQSVSHRYQIDDLEHYRATAVRVEAS